MNVECYKLLKFTNNFSLKSFFVEEGKYCIYYKFDEETIAFPNTIGIFCFDDMDSVNLYFDYCNFNLVDDYIIEFKNKQQCGVLVKCRTNKFKYIYKSCPSFYYKDIDRFYENNMDERLSVSTHIGTVCTNSIIIRSDENRKLKRFIDIKEMEFYEMNMNVFN